MENATMKTITSAHSGSGASIGLTARLLALLALIMLPWGQALATTVKSINFNSLPGDKVQIRLDFDSVPPKPKGYSIQQPARIALDLPGVDSSLVKKKHTLNSGNLQSVMVLEGQGRTRVILNLVQLAPYKTRVDGDSLYITLGNDVAKSFLKKPTKSLKQQFEGSAPEKKITKLDFKRGEDGAGKLMLTLSDPHVDVDVRKEGRKIKLTFKGVDLPKKLQRNYDVMDFATPVKSVTARYKHGVTTISLEPTGQYEYLAYQADDRYVVSVRPMTKEEQEKKKQEFKYTGQKLSLNFQDIDVRAVLQLIADFTNLNLVASDTVKGKITLRLQNVPWDQALDIILKTKGLDKRKIGNVLMVAPAAEMAAREKQQIETNKQLQELAPLQTEFIRIQYANAADIYKLFKSGGGGGNGGTKSTASMLSPRGSVVVDERTNSLLITDTAQKIEELRRLIKRIDVPVRQVMIEARIVEANSDFSKELGIRWGGAHISSHGITTGSVEAAASIQNSIVQNGIATIPYPDALAVDLGVTTSSASSMAVSYLTKNLDLTAELSALQSSGNGEIVSQPKVITGDKQQASIKSGQEVPYLESSSSGRTTVKFKDAVLKLDVTPNITPNDRVLMNLVVTQDSVASYINGEFNSQVPIINTKELVTQVLVDNGETIVLGGVFEVQDFTQVTKTPFLGDIPYLGRLFKKTSDKKTKTETLIFITPRILSSDLTD